MKYGLHRDAAWELPTWPVTVLFVGFPAMWLVGLGSATWIIVGALMVALLALSPDPVRVPKGFGIWLIFLVWVLLSVSQIDSAVRVVGFAFRFLQYAGCTAIFVYVYNLRFRVPTSFFINSMVGFFAVTVAGGYLAIFFPLLTFTTPAASLVPESLLGNDLVREMVIIRTTQFNPGAFTVLDPRPSAPFLYTNNWGNVYSLLVPLVVLALSQSRTGLGRLFLSVLLMASIVPAVLTLNRGMFLGLAVAMLYLCLRFALAGHVRAFITIASLGGFAAFGAIGLGAQERIQGRLENSATNESRVTVYAETFKRTLESPWFGYGAPRPAVTPGVPALGTQGQLWMILFSFGFVGAFLYLAWWAGLFLRTLKAKDIQGIVINSVLLMLLVETVYYGMLPQGIAIGMLVASLALPLPAPSGGAADPPRHRSFDESLRRSRGQ